VKTVADERPTDMLLIVASTSD